MTRGIVSQHAIQRPLRAAWMGSSFSCANFLCSLPVASTQAAECLDTVHAILAVALMEVVLPLLRGHISLEEALKDDNDVIQELSYPEMRSEFWLHLYRCRPHIEEIISQHLNVPCSDFRLGDVREWLHGSFNACLPFYINANPRTSRLPKKGIIRFPLPYKIGEKPCPGNVDEKVRCEAATYIWLQRSCPKIPVPRLLGFGLPCGQSVSPEQNARFQGSLSEHFILYLVHGPGKRVVSWPSLVASQIYHGTRVRYYFKSVHCAPASARPRPRISDYRIRL